MQASTQHYSTQEETAKEKGNEKKEQQQQQKKTHQINKNISTFHLGSSYSDFIIIFGCIEVPKINIKNENYTQVLLFKQLKNTLKHGLRSLISLLFIV